MKPASAIPGFGRRLKAVPLRVWIYGGILAPAILVAAVVWVALSYQPAPTVLELCGSPAEMGRECGRRFALQAVLRNPNVLVGNNIYSVIFDFPGNRLWLASGTIPAALAEYRELPRF